MTEAEWLKCTNTRPILQFIEGIASDRKLRLFATACYRRCWRTEESHLAARVIRLVERFVDHRASPEELAAEERSLRQSLTNRWGVRDETRHGRARAVAHDLTTHCFSASHAIRASETVRELIGAQVGSIRARKNRGPAWMDQARAAEAAENRFQCTALRCCIGPAFFRPLSLRPVCLTAHVRALTHTIYEERAYDHLPILADALEDAGCENADILDHCRQPGEHVRGCWVLDLVLNKT